MTTQQRLLNMYFRNGSPETVFEYGQTQVPAWQGKTEEQVLCERVRDGHKPLASIVNPVEARGLAKEYGLAYHEYQNEWDVRIGVLVKDPDRTLGSFLKKEEATMFRHVEPLIEELSKIPLGYYIEYGAPDMSRGDTPLECGLAYGYDLEQTLDLYQPLWQA
mgnify:CR=1 FL=1